MSHFAQIDENNIVVQVIVAEQDFIDTLDNPESWIQTSYNTRGGVHYSHDSNEPDGGIPLRKNYAGIGFTYDPELDAFIPPKPYASWLLNTDTCMWEPPTPKPELTEEQIAEGQAYYNWDEDSLSWVLVP
jgi:hypothetical protein